LDTKGPPRVAVVTKGLSRVAVDIEEPPRLAVDTTGPPRIAADTKGRAVAVDTKGPPKFAVDANKTPGVVWRDSKGHSRVAANANGPPRVAANAKEPLIKLLPSQEKPCEALDSDPSNMVSETWREPPGDAESVIVVDKLVASEGTCKYDRADWNCCLGSSRINLCELSSSTTEATKGTGEDGRTDWDRCLGSWLEPPRYGGRNQRMKPDIEEEGLLPDLWSFLIEPEGRREMETSGDVILARNNNKPITVKNVCMEEWWNLFYEWNPWVSNSTHQLKVIYWYVSWNTNIRSWSNKKGEQTTQLKFCFIT
jgi:hypothetical protein